MGCGVAGDDGSTARASLSHSLTLSLAHSRTLALSHSPTLPLAHSLTLSLAQSLPGSLSRSLTRSLTLSLSLTRSLSQSLTRYHLHSLCTRTGDRASAARAVQAARAPPHHGEVHHPQGRSLRVLSTLNLNPQTPSRKASTIHPYS